MLLGTIFSVLIIKQKYFVKCIDCRNASFTLLMLAAQKGHDKVAEILLNYGANIEAKADRRNFQDTPLLIACRTNHYKVVELLLNYGANIEYQDDIDKTPMCYAAINGNVKIIKLLLGHGAEINADIHDYTPLMLAIWQKSVGKSNQVNFSVSNFFHEKMMNYKKRYMKTYTCSCCRFPFGYRVLYRC